MHKLLVSLFSTAAMLSFSACAQGERASAPAYTLLDENATQLRADFNQAKGSVRLVFVVDPICPGCLRGLDDLNKALLETTNDPRLQTFVVHVSVLGATVDDIAPAAKLLQNAHIHHYWNPSGDFGRQLAKAVGLKRGDEPVYAWDVWLVYGPEASWDGALPPPPQLLMHQLRALQGNPAFPRLNGTVFADDVQQLLAKLPPAKSSQ